MDSEVVTLVRNDVADLVVERSVVQCVNFLVHLVAHQARFHGLVVDQHNRVNSVPGKQRHKGIVVHVSRAPRTGLLTKRMRAANLTQRKRSSKGFAYRHEVLQRLAAARAEHDLEWLQYHCQRLATLVARQDLYELLPEGVMERCLRSATFL